MKIAVLQMQSVSDVSANIAQFERLAAACMRDDKPDWMALPEHWNWAGGTSDDKVKHADMPEKGLAYLAAQAFARQHRVFVHAGSILTKVPGESRVYNRTVVFDRSGQEVARYDKIHLFDITTPDGTAYLESATVKPGSQIVTYECEGFKVGCAICYDLRFPELFQAFQAAGCDVIALPASFTLQTGKDHWEVLLRARAIETQCYVIAPGQTGFFTDGDGAKRFTYGHSLIADPWGHVVAKASDGTGYIAARLDKELIKRVRGQIPIAAHKVLGSL
jgi:deaminated glutathione amidase